MKEFADDNFTFHQRGEKGEKHWGGKGETARCELFLLFPQCFQKTCTSDM